MGILGNLPKLGKQRHFAMLRIFISGEKNVRCLNCCWLTKWHFSTKSLLHLQILLDVLPHQQWNNKSIPVPGAEVSKGKNTISHRKNLPIECAQGQLARCPNQIFCVLVWSYFRGGDVMLLVSLEVR